MTGNQEVCIHSIIIAVCRLQYAIECTIMSCHHNVIIIIILTLQICIYTLAYLHYTFMLVYFVTLKKEMSLMLDVSIQTISVYPYSVIVIIVLLVLNTILHLAAA